MSDPSIEAAQRAWQAEGWGDGPLAMSEGHLAEAAAREALKPIREAIEKLKELDRNTILNSAVLLRAIAPLIFTTEELER